MSWERLTADCLSLPRAGETASRPKAISAGTVLTSIVPGITLSVSGSATGPVTFQTSSYTSSGTRVFGNASGPTLDDLRFLRVDFASPVSSVSLDLVPDDSSAPSFLKAHNSAGTLLVANVASGTDLSALGITQSSIKLRGNLATADAAVTPALLDWTVNWMGATSYLTSAWSNVLSSTQLDASAPARPAGRGR